MHSIQIKNVLQEFDACKRWNMITFATHILPSIISWFRLIFLSFNFVYYPLFLITHLGQSVDIYIWIYPLEHGQTTNGYSPKK